MAFTLTGKVAVAGRNTVTHATRGIPRDAKHLSIRTPMTDHGGNHIT